MRLKRYLSGYKPPSFRAAIKYTDLSERIKRIENEYIEWLVNQRNWTIMKTRNYVENQPNVTLISARPEIIKKGTHT